MTYEELLKRARANLNGGKCMACPVCNGKACLNKIPGPGAKGLGHGAVDNYDEWKKYKLLINTIYHKENIDTSFDFFGYLMSSPIIVGPVGAISNHYNDRYNDLSYNEIAISGAHEAGVIAFTGDGLDERIMENSCTLIKARGGIGVPTIKPWDKNTFFKKLELANESNAVAIASDIDAAGLPFLRNALLPSGPKDEIELREIISKSKKPFIVKGIMTVDGAIKAVNAGAKAIVVSNHGGRVLDEVAPTAAVLEDIASAVKDKCMVIVDGGIRSGADIFKALALGADAVLIARPFVTALYGGEREGIKLYANKLKSELIDSMEMCGARSLKDINRNMIIKK